MNIHLDVCVCADVCWVPCCSQGYGDIFPLTLCGRALSIMSALVGTLIVAGLMAAFTSTISLSPLETRMVEFVGKNAAKDRLRDAASSTIAHWWRMAKVQRQLPLLID
jgi:hypothetical protein